MTVEVVPRKIVLRFPSRCRHCDKKLKAGTTAWFHVRENHFDETKTTFVWCGTHKLSTILSPRG